MDDPWFIFIWTVIPSGAVVAAMLGSGQALAMSCASKVLSTPLNVGALRISIAVLLTGLCGVLAAVSYSGLCRSEVRVSEMEGSPLAQTLILRDQQQRLYFNWGRNYYLSLLGLTLWLTAWRLKALYDNKQLGPPRALERPVSRAARAFYAVVTVLALLSADVPLCRINYNLMLATTVTPRKARLEHSIGACETAYYGTATGPCRDWCFEVERLSKERLATVLWARNWHVLGKYGARLFDDTRGVEQGEQRIEEFFRTKPCAQVLKSVDKSNQMVNWICIFFAAVSIIGAFSALSMAYEGTWYGNFGGADWYNMAQQHED